MPANARTSSSSCSTALTSSSTSSSTDHAWTAIKYPNAIYDEQAGEWISDAEIAEVPYTAFASKRAHRTDGRLIVRRVRRLNPKAAAQGQGELFATYRYHAVFTDSPFQLVQAESDHRGHAVVEQVFADLIDGPWAHLPSAAFNANAAWVQLAVTAHALTRALGAAGLDPARPRPRRDHPRRTHPGRRPPRPQRTRHHHLAPTRGLALAGRLAQRVRRHPPGTTARGSLTLTTRPHGHDRRPQWTRRMRRRPIPHAHKPKSPIEDQPGA